MATTPQQQAQQEHDALVKQAKNQQLTEAAKYADQPSPDNIGWVIGKDIVHGIGSLFSDDTPAVPSTSDLLKKIETKRHTTTETSKQPENPWAQLAEQTANELAGNTALMAQQASGATGDAAVAQADAQALNDLGQSQTSPMAQWLQQNAAEASAQNTGVANAEAAQEQSFQLGDAGIQKAIKGLGAATEASIQAAPYEQLLQGLVSSVPYTLSKGYGLPGFNDPKQLPNWLNQVMYQTGATAGNANAGAAANQGTLPAPTVAAQGVSTGSQAANAVSTGPSNVATPGG
jgi:hypothetical protein